MFFSADSTLLLAVANPGGYASLLVAPLQLRRGSCDPLLPLLHRHLNLRLMRLIILPHRLRAVQLLLPNRPVNRIPALRQPLQHPAVPSYRQPLRISLPPNRKNTYPNNRESSVRATREQSFSLSRQAVLGPGLGLRFMRLRSLRFLRAPIASIRPSSPSLFAVTAEGSKPCLAIADILPRRSPLHPARRVIPDLRYQPIPTK